MKQFQQILGVGASIMIILSSLVVITSGVLGVAGEPFSTESKDWTYETDWIKLRGHVELSDRYNDQYYSIQWKEHSGQNLAEPMFFAENYLEWYIEPGQFFKPKIKSPSSNKINDWCIDYWYEWYVNGDIKRSNPIEEPYHYTNEDLWEGDVDLNAGVWHRVELAPDDFPYTGDEVGEVEVVLRASFNLIHQGWLEDDQLDYEGEGEPLSKDGAYLRKGSGEVRAVEEVVEVGEDARIFVRTAWIHNQGWTLRFYPPTYIGTEPIDYGKGNPLGFFDGSDDLNGYVNFPVPEHWFKIGEPDSECVVELWNQFWRESFTGFFTIDNLEWAPEKARIVSVVGNFEVGETLDVHVQCDVNNITKSPISHFWIYVYYGVAGTMPGSNEFFIIQKQRFDADEDGNVYFNFNIPRDGNVIIRALAVDEDGRTSKPGYYQVVVYPVEDGIEGFGDWVQPVFPWMASLGVILIVLFSLILAGAVMYFGYKWKVDLKYLALILVILFISAVVGAYTVGINPGG